MYFFSILLEADNHKDVFKMSKGEVRRGLFCQILVKQTTTHGQSMMQMQSSETGLQLQQALEQISNISTALCDIQRCYQDQVCVGVITIIRAKWVSILVCFLIMALFLSGLYSDETESKLCG